jgi:hypothetical protein
MTNVNFVPCDNAKIAAALLVHTPKREDFYNDP